MRETITTAVVLLTTVSAMLMYMKMSLSKHKQARNYAFLIKIALLVLTFILTLLKKEFLVVGQLAFGGRSAALMLLGFEIIDTILEHKKER